MANGALAIRSQAAGGKQPGGGFARTLISCKSRGCKGSAPSNAFRSGKEVWCRTCGEEIRSPPGTSVGKGAGKGQKSAWADGPPKFGDDKKLKAELAALKAEMQDLKNGVQAGVQPERKGEPSDEQLAELVAMLTNCGQPADKYEKMQFERKEAAQVATDPAILLKKVLGQIHHNEVALNSAINAVKGAEDKLAEAKVKAAKLVGTLAELKEQRTKLCAEVEKDKASGGTPTVQIQKPNDLCPQGQLAWESMEAAITEAVTRAHAAFLQSVKVKNAAMDVDAEQMQGGVAPPNSPAEAAEAAKRRKAAGGEAVPGADVTGDQGAAAKAAAKLQEEADGNFKRAREPEEQTANTVGASSSQAKPEKTDPNVKVVDELVAKARIDGTTNVGTGSAGGGKPNP
jgi:cell division protein FtsB